MTKTFPRSKHTERKWHVCQDLKRRLGMTQKFFDDSIVLRDPADPYVPGLVRSDGAPIPRLKPVPPPVPPRGFFPQKFLDADAYPVELFSEDVGALLEDLRDAVSHKSNAVGTHLFLVRSELINSSRLPIVSRT
jgi:hypothetical protein